MDKIDSKEAVTVFRTYDDGYIVRSMTSSDVKTALDWFARDSKRSRYDLEVPFNLFPKNKGFYVGEYMGKAVATTARIPWADSVYFGSYYFVDLQYRGRGFGTRMRDEVAREHIGENILCVDAIIGKVSEKNEQKFGYKTAFTIGRFNKIVKSESTPPQGFSGRLVKVSDVEFDDVIAYDNKCFLSSDYPLREEFLREWVVIPGGAAIVAVSESGDIVGFGCRRPCLQKRSHLIGPLYADSLPVSESLMQELCVVEQGDDLTVEIWSHNKDAVALMKKYNFKHVLDMLRMHVNGDPQEYKPQVYCLTAELCGF